VQRLDCRRVDNVYDNFYLTSIRFFPVFFETVISGFSQFDSIVVLVLEMHSDCISVAISALGVLYFATTRAPAVVLS